MITLIFLISGGHEVKKKSLEDLEVNGKVVLMRVDYNVPLTSDMNITDDTRIQASLPSIKYLIEQGAKVVLFSHLGRIKKEEDKKGKSLAPIAARLADLLGQDVLFSSNTRGTDLEEAIQEMDEGEVLLVENTRFEDVDGQKESSNNTELGQYWASLGDIFVNDAFGTSHRAHASNVGISQNVAESAVGFLVEKELEELHKAIDNPERPFVAILGGSKVKDKIRLIETLLQQADRILIGGGMAYTFMKARGQEIGESLLDAESLDFAEEMLAEAQDKIILPVDTLVASEFSSDAVPELAEGDIPDGKEGLDIGPKTLELFKEHLEGARTVIWNGPVGVFEFDNFSEGTRGLSETVAQLEDARTIVGGGDSATAAKKFSEEEDFTHISTGGGASLAVFAGEELPGIEAINDI